MSEKRLFGVVIPTITPMKENGKLDEESLGDFIEYLVRAGVNCLYPNGTNGESLLLSKEEREQIAKIVVDTDNHRIPTFIQCGSMTTEETASHVRHAREIGADGVGIMSPAFFPMDEESLFQYYADVLADCPEDFPVYVYNIPGCTTSDVKPELLKRLMDTFPNIVGIKYSNSDLMRVEDYLNQGGRRPEVLIGCDSLFLQCMITGGVGTVTGPGAIFHERFNRLYEQYQSGDMIGAMKTQQQIVELDRKIANIPGIPGLKALLKLRGIIKNDTCRGPLRKLTKEEYKVLDQVVENYNFSESQ